MHGFPAIAVSPQTAPLQVLPSGLVVPPLPYVLALVVLTAGVLGALYTLRPPVTQRQVLAFSPWMASGGILHVLSQADSVPPILNPFVTAPAVYVSTFGLAGVVWSGAAWRARATDEPERIARALGVGGGLVFLALAGLAYAQALGADPDPISLAWPAVGYLGSALLFAPLYSLLVGWQGDLIAPAGLGGWLAVYAHVADGVSTTIGVDRLGTVERTPIPRHIMDFAGTLPTAPYLGRGWLFVLVKFAVAVLIVAALADYVEDDPDQGNLLLAFVAAVGLGPASNNLFLFLLGESMAV